MPYWICFRHMKFDIAELLLLMLLGVTCASGATKMCPDGSMCSFWASEGQCESDTEYMLLNCPRACRNPCLCDVSAFTNDTACDCLIKAKSGYCNTSGAMVDCRTTCTKVSHESCPLLPLPLDPNAYLSTWSTQYLITVIELCHVGYLPLIDDNQGMKTCSANGKWIEDYLKGAPVECTPVSCGNPQYPKNTFCVAMSTTYGGDALCACATGYVPDHGQTTLTCNASGLWEGDPLTCKRIDCGRPPSSANATVTVLDTTLGSSANYTCMTGYNLTHGDTSLTCNTSGKWHGNLIACKVIDCGRPPLFPRTQVQLSGTTYNLSANYSCLPGYQYEQGQYSLICDQSGIWAGIPLKCKITNCGSPPTAASLSVQVTNTSYGHSANYSCIHGYSYSSGDSSLTCDLSGKWAGQLMKCLANNPPPVAVTSATDSFDVAIIWAVGVTIFIVVAIVVIVCVVIKLGPKKKRKKLKKAATSLGNGLKSLINFQVRLNLGSKSGTIKPGKLFPELQTVKQKLSSIKSITSLQAMEQDNSTKLDRNIKPSYFNISNHLPVSTPPSSSSLISIPKSLSSITISSISQPASPELMPQVAS